MSGGRHHSHDGAARRGRSGCTVEYETVGWPLTGGAWYGSRDLAPDDLWIRPLSSADGLRRGAASLASTNQAGMCSVTVPAASTEVKRSTARTAPVFTSTCSR